MQRRNGLRPPCYTGEAWAGVMPLAVSRSRTCTLLLPIQGQEEAPCHSPSRRWRDLGPHLPLQMHIVSNASDDLLKSISAMASSLSGRFWAARDWPKLQELCFRLFDISVDALLTEAMQLYDASAKTAVCEHLVQRVVDEVIEANYSLHNLRIRLMAAPKGWKMTSDYYRQTFDVFNVASDSVSRLVKTMTVMRVVCNSQSMAVERQSG